MRKKISLFLVLIITLMFPVVVNAQVYSDKHPTNNNQIVVNDTAGVFTQEQFNEMKNNMIPLLEKGNVMVVTRRSAGERNIEIVADEEYKKVFSTNNGVILVINIYNGADSSGTDADWHNHMTLRGYGTMVLNDNRRNQVYQENRKLLQEAKFLELVKNSFDAVCIFNDIKKYEKESVNASDIEGVVLEDDADILTDEEESKLADIMAPLTEYGHIIFKTISENDTTTQTFAHNYYYDKFGNESGTMLIIDMYNRYIYICSAGNNYKVITKNKADIITDNIYTYAKNEDYYGCAAEAFTEIKALLDGGKIAEPMRYASNIVISLVIGFFLTFFFAASSMKVKRSVKSKNIEKLGKSVMVAGVNVMQTGQHKVYSPVSDDSGFSSGGGGGFSGGGGGGGGGGFSGGGGGHSF